MYFLIFHIMQTTLSWLHLDYVSCHIDQTPLVEFLLTIPEGICFEDIEGLASDSEIFQWLIFPNFCSSDRNRLIKAQIPVLDSKYGRWIGITSFGSDYDLYVYPELIQALFDIECSYNEITNLRCP